MTRSVSSTLVAPARGNRLGHFRRAEPISLLRFRCTVRGRQPGTDCQAGVGHEDVTRRREPVGVGAEVARKSDPRPALHKPTLAMPCALPRRSRTRRRGCSTQTVGVSRQTASPGYCQVDENRCDRPTRYCGRSPSWADMLGIRIGLMPQLDCEHDCAACRGHSVTLVGVGGRWPDPQLD